MGKVINIQPITRIEGHAKVAIHLNDEGNVSDTFLHVQALRGFEKFCEGRPVEEMPRIVCHICGICPWAHHLASSKAGGLSWRNRAFGSNKTSKTYADDCLCRR